MDSDEFEAYFKTIFHNSGTAGIIYEEKTVIIANDQCQELFGYESEDMIGKNLLDFVFEEDFGIFEQCCESGVCSEETAQNDEIRIITSKNKVKNAIIRISSIPNTSKCYISFLDINDQRIVEKALSRSQGNFNAITESAIDGIITADSNGNIVYSNPSFRKIFGYSSDEILGKSVSILMPERFRDGFNSKMRHFQQTGEHLLVGKIFESIGLKKNGEEFPFEMSITYWKSGGEKYQTSIVRNITARKSVEKSLKDSEELFKEVFNKVNDIMTLIEIDENGRAGNFIKVNDVAVEKLGYSWEEFAKMTPKNIGSTAPNNRKRINELISDGRVTFQRTYFTKDGNSLPVEINSHIFDFKGKKVALSVARDITERKKSESEIQRLANIVESSEDSIVGYNLDGIILNWNKGAEKIYGYSADEIKGKSVSYLMKPEQLKENLQNIEKIKRGEKVSHFETTRLRKDGSEFDVSITLSPIKDDNGQIIGMSTITRDITERKESENALEYTQIQLENAMDLAHLVSWEMDMSLGIFTFNDSFYAMYGTTADKEGGYKMSAEDYVKNFVHPDDAELVVKVINDSVNNESSGTQIEHRIIRRDGETRHIVVNIRLIPDDEGNVIGGYGANQDITERKNAEEALKASEERYRRIVEKFIQNALALIGEINKV